MPCNATATARAMISMELTLEQAALALTASGVTDVRTSNVYVTGNHRRTTGAAYVVGNLEGASIFYQPALKSLTVRHPSRTVVDRLSASLPAAITEWQYAQLVAALASQGTVLNFAQTEAGIVLEMEIA